MTGTACATLPISSCNKKMRSFVKIFAIFFKKLISF
jgi:hypothetical protein